MDGGSLGLGPHSAGFPNTGCAARTLEIGFQRSARMSERVSTLPLDQTGWIPWKVDALSRERTTRASAHNPAVLARRLSRAYVAYRAPLENNNAETIKTALGASIRPNRITDPMQPVAAPIRSEKTHR